MVQGSPAVLRVCRDGSRATDFVGDDVPQSASRPVLKWSSHSKLRTTDIAREGEISAIGPRTPHLCVFERSDREGRSLAWHHSGSTPSEPSDGARSDAFWIQGAPLDAVSVRPAAMMDTQHVVPALLGAIAGYVDTVGFLTLYGMFTAHITGDLVASVAEHSPASTATRLAMLPAFIVSVAVATVLARATRRDGHAPLFPLLALMTAALAVFGATGILLRPFMTGPSNWAVGIIGTTAVAAMAIQNMLMRDALSSWTPTTIMTGNLTLVTIQLVEMVFATTEPDAQERARIRRDAKQRLVKFGLPLTGFVLGAMLSAFLTPRYGFWSVGVPMAVVATLTGWHWRQAR
jgi:uncharacterized membrane protein YoaK (UPF0700 family)